jgi:hypothetical protein
MGGLLYPIAELLVRQPAGTGEGHAAPTFGFHEFTAGDPKAELAERCEALLGDYPELGGDDAVRRLIDLLPPVHPVRTHA